MFIYPNTQIDNISQDIFFQETLFRSNREIVDKTFNWKEMS